MDNKFSLPHLKDLLVHWRLDYFVALLHHKKVVPEKYFSYYVRWSITRLMEDMNIKLS